MLPDIGFNTFNVGRGGEIRTPDPLVPNQMRYQAALRPEQFDLYFRNLQNQALLSRNLNYFNNSLNRQLNLSPIRSGYSPDFNSTTKFTLF